MDTTINDFIMAVAIVIAMVFLTYVALKQSDANICVDITSLTEATAADLAMALKYASFASANQVVKNFKFPDRFKIELTKKDLTVKYVGSCPEKGEYTMEHNVERIKDVIIEDSKKIQRTTLCIKKYLENCDQFVTICLASDSDCCVVEPSDCGGYSDGVTFLDVNNKVEWKATILNRDTYLVKDYECSGDVYFIKNIDLGSSIDHGAGIRLDVFKNDVSVAVYSSDVYIDSAEVIDDTITIRLTEALTDKIIPRDGRYVSGEVVCGTY